ncbi:MAG: potassium channel family protein [Rhodoblastus sp.]
MLRQILVGSAASLTNVAIHSLFMLLVLWAARTARNVRVAQPDMRLVIVMVATVSALMIAHFCEVMIWAQTYRLIGAVETEFFEYFAFVNFTTLGYGDILPVAQWRLIGPITAMNGIVMFGWSTAVIFDVLRRMLEESDAVVR